MERAVVERVLGRQKMIVVAVVILFVVTWVGSAICTAIPGDPYKDQEQVFEEIKNEKNK